MKYNYPGKFKPRIHQERTTEFLVNNPRAFCFNALGTGKTASALWAADFLMSIGAIKKCLILTTLSTIKDVWDNEIFGLLLHRKAVVLYGSKQKRIDLLTEEADFYLINHDGVKVLQDELIKKKEITHVIVDESAILRHANTQRYKAIKAVIGKRTAWLVTGSPTPNEPTDIWAQARIICPEKVPMFFTQFKRRVMYQVSQFKWLPRANWQAVVSQVAQPAMRYTLEECIDLPPCVVYRRHVDMTPLQSRTYDDLLKDFYAEMQGGNVVALNEAARRQKLLQVASGAVYDSARNVLMTDCEHKYQALNDILEEVGFKTIIFAPFKHTLEHLKKYVTSLGVSCEIVSGDVSLNNRTEIFTKFKQDELQVIIAHPVCMSHGLNLTASSSVVWFSPIDSCETYQQANGRIRRHGQEHKQVIFQMSCCPLEEAIYKRLESKQEMQGLLLDIIRNLYQTV